VPKYIPESITYEQLEQTDWPEDILIDGGLLSKGDRMLIGAESKGGKSTFVNDINRECLSGGSFLGFKITRPLKILYMQAELRERRLKERLIPNVGKLPIEHKRNFYIWSTKNRVLISNSEGIEKISQELAYVRPDIWEIDPMINFHTYDENSATQMAMFFRTIDRLKDEFDLAIIMPHHFKKKNIEFQISLLDYIRGSSALRGWADTTIALEGRTSSEYRSLEFELRNSDEPVKRVIKYNKETKSFDWSDPFAELATFIRYEMNSKELTTKEVDSIIKNECGHLFSNNHSRMVQARNELIRTKILSKRCKGTKSFYKLI